MSFETTSTVFLVGIVMYILGRATEKAKWIEKFVDIESIKAKFKHKEFEESELAE